MLLQRAGTWSFKQLYPSCGMNTMKFRFLFLAGEGKQGESSTWALKKEGEDGKVRDSPSKAPPAPPAAGAGLPHK